MERLAQLNQTNQLNQTKPTVPLAYTKSKYQLPTKHPYKIHIAVRSDLSYDQRMQRIAGSLQAAGYEVEMIGRSLPGSIPLTDSPYRQRRYRLWWQTGKLSFLEHNFRLFWTFLRTRSNLFYAVDLDTIVPLLLVGKLRGIPVFYDAHEYFPEVPEVARRPRTQRIWRAVERWAIPKTAGRITVNQSLAKLFQDTYQLPFGVVRNVPKQRAYRAVAKTQPPVLLYQGVLNEGRGIETLLRAIQQLPEAQLWLAGEGDLSEALRQMAQKLEVTKRVKFLGYLQPDELASITNQATIGLNLLENAGLSYYYSLANKAFDYMQAGIPAIHMDFPEYRYLQEQYGCFVLVPDLEISTLVQAIKELLNNSQHYQLIAKNAQQAASNFTWDKEEETLLDAMNKVVG